MSEQEAAEAVDSATAPESSEAAPAAPTATALSDESGAQDGTVVLDDLGSQSFSDAVDETIVAFDDGDIVTGKVVKKIGRAHV